MKSPFAQAEIASVFPHRKHTPYVTEVVEHIKDLIAKGIDTHTGISGTKYVTLQRKYFVGASVNTISEALSRVDAKVDPLNK